MLKKSALDRKLVVGQQHDSAFKKPTTTPCATLAPTGANNASWSTPAGPGVPCDCGAEGWLFNLKDDPHETADLAASQPARLRQLQARLQELRKAVYAPDRGPVDERACEAIAKYSGFWGPWL